MTGDDLKAIRDVVREEFSRLLAAQADRDRLLDVDEAALRLGLSTSTVYKKSQTCEIPSVKIGGRVLFRPLDLDAYAEARRRSPERVMELAGRVGGGVK
jgi:excisionase family DNA binding protein